jgi:hypothetical protein
MAVAKHPEVYHRKQITFVAVAIGDGPTLELRRDAKSADHLSLLVTVAHLVD